MLIARYASRILTLEFRRHFLLTALLSTGFAMVSNGASADDVNVTGQSRNTPGTSSPAPGDPGKDSSPTLPGDRPAKQGTDPSSQVHNVDPRALSGEKRKSR